jgi:hypothetical protein
MALPIFGVFKKAPRDLSMWTDYPVKLTEPVRIDPFIEINLDSGPITIHGITFSVSDLMPVRLTQGLESVPPTKASVEKLRDILKSNDGGTVDIIWGPDTYPTWVKIHREEDNNSFLIPLSSGEFSRSKFIDDCIKDDPGHAWRFYHIVCGKYNNFWSIGL